ncbi:uncharacterized protein LOC5576860 isoform X2 [Aedes aegypti]|nr:uncharacterized protein LOC5576860 isoform X2 [Aedes aegypti]
MDQPKVMGYWEGSQRNLSARISNSRVVLREFLELYKSLPCLWNMQCKEYANREMKTEAYKLMVQKLAELEPGAHRATVIRKINNMRSNYRKEKRKVQTCLANGQRFVPTLWYYPLMGFLDGQDESGNSDSEGIDIECVKVQIPDSPEPHSEDADEAYSLATTTELSNSELIIPIDDFPTKEDTAGTIDLTNERKRKHEGATASDQNHFRTTVNNGEDRHDAFGRSIAFKLRALSDEQRIYAEKLIIDALHEAELGNLNKYCRLQL